MLRASGTGMGWRVKCGDDYSTTVNETVWSCLIRMDSFSAKVRRLLIVTFFSKYFQLIKFAHKLSEMASKHAKRSF